MPDGLFILYKQSTAGINERAHGNDPDTTNAQLLVMKYEKNVNILATNAMCAR